MEPLKNKIWIWGHPLGSLAGCAGLSGGNTVDIMDGARSLHAENIFWIHFGRGPERREESLLWMEGQCRRFGYRITPAHTAETMLEERKTHPHMTIAVYDDFFRDEYIGNNYIAHPPEELAETKRRLNEAGMELWCVFYERDIGMDISPFLPCFDGFTFWFWSQPGKEEHERVFRRFYEKTPGKKRMLGCYLYDFGRSKAADPDLCEAELEKDKFLLQSGKIEGVILHTNAVGGMGFEAYERAAAWMTAHENDPV